jgi:hypothetical protein
MCDFVSGFSCVCSHVRGRKFTDYVG